ncbi:copper resistance protein CopC [Gemmatimonas sp.]|uniref:copper resistance CopC family protein n=1 Tax=Gemmatimonas sp. TaxID=1962908 RepID=UPI00286AC546|nr:copper resistance protein CopC [Gemmatimonas sp.]
MSRALVRSTVLFAALALSAPVLASGAVMRHLKLVRSFPAADTVLVGSPEKITIELSEAVELTGAKLTLAKDGGAPIALGALRREPTLPKILRADVTTALAAGGYVVSWRTMSKDGHVVKGTFGFRVGAAK